MAVGVDTDEFTYPPGTPELAEMCNESSGVSGDTNDSTVDMYDVGIQPVDFSAGC